VLKEKMPCTLANGSTLAEMMKQKPSVKVEGDLDELSDVPHSQVDLVLRLESHELGPLGP